MQRCRRLSLRQSWTLAGAGISRRGGNESLRGVGMSLEVEDKDVDDANDYAQDSSGNWKRTFFSRLRQFSSTLS